MLKITLPSEIKKIKGLKAGDTILISGSIYTARDQAHKRLAEAIEKGRALPFALRGQVIYYCGPTPRPKGRIIGSCGPTTSSRMDAFTPVLLKAGIAGMIGKGRRAERVLEAIKRHRAAYFLAYAGCGALISGYVTKMELVAFGELGPEAIYRLEVRDLPLIVGIDTNGRSIYG